MNPQSEIESDAKDSLRPQQDVVAQPKEQISPLQMQKASSQIG